MLNEYLSCSLVAPKIDRRNLKSLTVREGEPILFDVKVSGEPAPDVVWSFNNSNISSNSVYQIDNIPYNTRFYHSNPMRSDTGIYKIVASNKYGEDEEEVEVTVIGKFKYKIELMMLIIKSFELYSQAW